MKEIKLTKSKAGHDLVALVSDEDFERVDQYNWTAHKGSSSGSRLYAVRNATVKIEVAPGVFERRRRWIRMHRFICDLPPGTLRSDLVPDHKDGNGLNNQRENLEVITHEENRKRAAEKKRQNVECFL